MTTLYIATVGFALGGILQYLMDRFLLGTYGQGYDRGRADRQDEVDRENRERSRKAAVTRKRNRESSPRGADGPEGAA